MSGEMPNVEWAGRASFAEAAEALGIETDAIIGAYQAGVTLLVAYTTEPGAVDGWVARFRRNADGILEQLEAPHLVPRMVADMVEQLAAEMTLKYGPPTS